MGKAYAAGQSCVALHTMALLQAYQADVLKDLNNWQGYLPEAVTELRICHATPLNRRPLHGGYGCLGEASLAQSVGDNGKGEIFSS